jgi:hypothetical protein
MPGVVDDRVLPAAGRARLIDGVVDAVLERLRRGAVALDQEISEPRAAGDAKQTVAVGVGGQQ